MLLNEHEHGESACELQLLRRIILNLRDTLRVRDERDIEKNIWPPKLVETQRKLRDTATHGTNSGEEGPNDPALVTAYIQGTMLLCYQERLPRWYALQRLAELMPVAKPSAAHNAFYCYATDDELRYNPFGRAYVTYGMAVADLIKLEVAFVKKMLPETRLKTRALFEFRCLKGRRHPTWTTSLNKVRNAKTPCPACQKPLTPRGRRAIRD